MTEYGAPFDGILIGDAAVKAPYSAAEWARLWKLLQGGGATFPNYGVLAGSGGTTYGPLEVRATAVISANVDVQIGAAVIDGRVYENTAVTTLAVGSNSSGNNRIDTVVVRLDYVAQTIRLVVKQGTPAVSPARVAMQQDATVWEIPLADIAVANGFVTLAQSAIGDRRRIVNTQSMGWQNYAFPQNYAFGSATSGNITMAPAETILVPILITGNMLVNGVSVNQATPAATAFTIGWDLYFEDTDDKNTSENTLRRVASSNGTLSGVSAGGSVEVVPTFGGEAPLTPGAYWLALQNRHAANNFLVAGATPGLMDTISNGRRKVTTNPNGQTLNAVTGGWSALVLVALMRMNGVVFGQ